MFKETAEYFSKVSALLDSYNSKRPSTIASSVNFYSNISSEDAPAAANEESKTPATPAKETKKQKAKKNKDPNAPKKPMSAFMLYTNHRRPLIRKENDSKLSA